MGCFLSRVIAMCDVCSAQVAPSSAGLVLPNPLTLTDAIRIALRQQPQQAIAQTVVTQADASKTQALAQYYPTVTPNYQYINLTQNTYGLTTSLLSGQTISLGGVTTERGGTGGVAVQQKLFDSGTREVNNALARQQIAAALAGSRDASQQVIANVTQAFYEELRSEDLKRVSDAQVARAQLVLDQVQGQIDAGVAPKKDIYQARADLDNALVSQLQNSDSVDTSSATLKNAMGIETTATPQPAPLSSGEDQLPSAPQADQPEPLDQYFSTAFSNRPDLLEQFATINEGNLNVKQAKINAGLAVSGIGQVNYTAINDVGTKGGQYEALLTLSYPLFDAGFSRAAIKSADAQRDSAIDRFIQIRQQIELDVESASVQRAESLKRITLAKSAVEAAQVNYDAAVESKKEGVGTSVDITTAEVTLTQAQNQYVTAIYDYYEADARLRRALGVNDQGLEPAHK